MASQHSAWSEENSQATLERLREDYPRYTDNELYAIWCREQGLIPTTPDGKVILEQWQMHATEDGEHVQDGGFKVSRPLYGRALKARKGTPKPAPAPRGSRAAADDGGPRAPQPRPGQILSDAATEMARRYDEAAAVVAAIKPLRGEIEKLNAKLKDMPMGVRQMLADADAEARRILEDAGLLGARAAGDNGHVAS